MQFSRSENRHEDRDDEQHLADDDHDDDLRFRTQWLHPLSVRATLASTCYGFLNARLRLGLVTLKVDDLLRSRTGRRRGLPALDVVVASDPISTQVLLWRGLFWEPWFVACGVLLGPATRYAQRRPIRL